MHKEFDRRVVSPAILDFVRACQQRVPCHLGGGAALAGAYLRHRVTGDVDLFSHQADEMRTLVRVLSDVAAAVGVSVLIVRDAGALVRARLKWKDGELELDVVHESVPDIEPPPPPLEGIVVESLSDLRANKLTCVLSRSEPRDLVDLYFLTAPDTLPNGTWSWRCARTPGSTRVCSLGCYRDSLPNPCRGCCSRLRLRAYGTFEMIWPSGCGG